MRLISLSNGHDASITAIENGKILYHWELERILNIKHFCGVDYANEITGVLLNHCLPILRWNVKDIDILVFGGKTEWKKTTFAGQVPQYDEANLDKPWAEGEVVLQGHTIKAYSITHHVNHLASAYYTSPFTSSLLYSLDGLGDRTSGMAGWAHKNKLYIKYSHFHKPIDGVKNNGIGLYYSYLGDIFPFLGKDLLAAAGKAMGLSSYGNIRREWLAECENALLQWMPQRPLQLPEKLGIDRNDLKDPMNPICQDLMATIQEALELYVVKSINKLSENFVALAPIGDFETSKRLCAAGGCMLNVLANTRILKETSVQRLHIPPVTSDCGISLGAALYVWHHILDNPFNGMEFFNPYIGDEVYNGPPTENFPEFKDNLSYYCDYHGINGEYVPDIIQFASKELANGKIIAWVQDRTEIGPRSLGNRSILCSPFATHDKNNGTLFTRTHNGGNVSSNTMKDIINEKVKHREFWRPFAPICLLEDASKWFDIDHEQPYMLEAPMAREWYLTTQDILANEDMMFHASRGYTTFPRWQQIPAVVHVDGTCRVQTVSIDNNRKLYELLAEFKKLTKIGVLLNTSLNDHGIPINNDSKDIFKLLKNTKLDYAIIGNIVFSKK